MMIVMSVTEMPIDDAKTVTTLIRLQRLPQYHPRIVVFFIRKDVADPSVPYQRNEHQQPLNASSDPSPPIAMVCKI